MEILEFLLSLFLSSLGVSMDLLTTHIFVRDLGLESEWNRFLKYIASRWGYRVWILCLEIPIIVGIAFFDSTYSSVVLSMGLSWFIGRGFAACHNLMFITAYRVIGIDKFRKQQKSSLEAIGSASFSSKFKLKLPYLMGLVISFIIYVSLCFVGFAAVTLIRSLSLGLIIFFLMKVAT